jgi:FkbM family methyltransferase
MINRIINRTKVYSLYFWEYLRYGEIDCLLNSIYFLFTKRSKTSGGIVKTSMGIFKTRPHTLDFQYVNYAYEIGIKHFIEKENCDIFIDAGACLGEYSIWMAKKGITCYTFEPVNSSYRMIMENIGLNNVSSLVNAYNYGLGNTDETSYFKINPINFGASKRVNNKEEGTDKFIIKRLDDVFDKFNIPTSANIIFKIDVEGMEAQLLEGAKRFIMHYPNLLFIIEEKHSGAKKLMDLLNNYCNFEYGIVDEYNFYARKK